MADQQLEFIPQIDVDGTPYVLMRWDDKAGAFTPTDCRRAALALLEAAEQADLEHDMRGYLLEGAGADGAGVARILVAFRHYRARQAGDFVAEADQ